MMKKGFTLIELLAVITILAIIALIAVPVVNNLTNGSANSSNKINASRYIEAVKLTLTNRELDGDKYLKSCTINDKLLVCDGETINVEIKGKYPSSGELLIEKTDVISADIKYDDNIEYLYLGNEELVEMTNEIKLLTVTFDPDGGTLMQNTKKVAKGNEIGLLPTPTKVGYEFMGWTNGINLAPDLSEWTLSGGATYDPIDGALYLPNTNSIAVSPMIYVGDTQINTIHTFKLSANIRGTANYTGYLAKTLYYTASKTSYSTNGNAREITQDWTTYVIGIAGATQISSGVCSYMTISFSGSSQYTQKPYYVKNVDLRVQTNMIDEYEPYYVTDNTIVNSNSDYTLKAVWKEIN